MSGRSGGVDLPNVGPWMDFVATWYTPQQGTGSGTITASGKPVSMNEIAVDPRIIPLGSVVQIEYADGHTEVRVAEDTGGAIIGNRIDVFTWSEADALHNGRQAVELRIIGHENLGGH